MRANLGGVAYDHRLVMNTPTGPRSQASAQQDSYHDFSYPVIELVVILLISL